ncbi:LmeA family phospholipid-binding protein [Sulfobacillus thermosulfidooxidans]|uniref:LmeA family phospholipid-binding protein n=1 Tax=Sulfobacillus thermosulfidooxidans TaxID=28034 RepID=UPI0006B502CF|nr:LmeA family phospholipid-binding protein [Sulfobacillus thermosulfidooxidans]
MSRFIVVLAGAVVLLGALQWTIPKWAAAQVADRVASQDGGIKPQVDIAALPFWIMAQGQFQDMYINVHNVHVDGLTLSQAVINWQNGKVSLPALSHNRLVIEKAGHVNVRIVFDGPALSAFLAGQSPIQNPQVTITNNLMTIEGRLLLGQLSVPLNAQGTLSVSPDKKAIIFHPTRVDGIQLPVLTDLQIFQIDSLNLPVAMVIQSVALRNNELIVEASTP